LTFDIKYYNEFFGTDYRRLVHKKYRIIHRVTEDSVFILRIIHESVDLRGFSFEIKACGKNNRRCPAGNALGVHIVDIPRIIFSA